MRRIILLFFAFLALTVSAQTAEKADSALVSTIIIGYLSYDSALHAMPDYATAQQQLANLREAYQKEMNRVEQEFNEKYEAFLDGQRDFPRTILLKRQTELQQLMQRNIDFKAQAQRELQQAETEAMQPLRQRLNQVLATLARECRYAIIINTDANACPFIDPLLGKDIQDEVNAIVEEQAL